MPIPQWLTIVTTPLVGVETEIPWCFLMICSQWFTSLGPVHMVFGVPYEGMAKMQCGGLDDAHFQLSAPSTVHGPSTIITVSPFAFSIHLSQNPFVRNHSSPLEVIFGVSYEPRRALCRPRLSSIDILFSLWMKPNFNFPSSLFVRRGFLHVPTGPSSVLPDNRLTRARNNYRGKV